VKCSKCIGELDYDAKVILSMCGQCDDPRPDERDLVSNKLQIMLYCKQPKKWHISCDKGSSGNGKLTSKFST